MTDSDSGEMFGAGVVSNCLEGMKMRMKISALMSLIAIGSVAVAGGAAQAATVYAGSAGNAIFSLAYPSPGNMTVKGIGDDYNTGASSISLTSLSFRGGTSVNTDRVAVKFFDESRVLVSTILPTAAEVFGSTSVHTLGSDYFTASGTTLPGKGFIVFEPYNEDGTRASFSLYFGGNATTGTNDNQTAAQTMVDGSLTTGRYVFGFGSVSQVAEMQLMGALLPEPTSLAIALAPVAFMAKRRRTA